MKTSLNFDWTYLDYENLDAISHVIGDGSSVDIPHANTIMPYNYVDEHSYQFKSTYQKRIKYQSSWEHQIIKICFEGVAHEAIVYVNGHYIGTHQGGYTPFSFDITKDILKDQDILITVFVDARESLNFPPFGHVIDYLTYGGIYREVYLDILNPTHIEDITITGLDLLKHPMIEAKVLLSQNEDTYLHLTILHEQKEVISYTFSHHEDNNHLQFYVPGLKLWDVDQPHLYQLIFKLYYRNQIVDVRKITTGFREAKFMPDGFYLNGKKIKIIGLNRHQDYPYVGYAMPKSAQYQDANILKNVLNLNMVRTSHYPQSRHFIDACDALGLLVFEEIPGWQHIGDNAWKDVAKSHVKEMILRDKNHPSVVLWGVRINESGDDDVFYTETNRIAKSIDPTRQTGGVRFITHSSILEDVFTLNDFIHEGHNIPLRRLKDVSNQANIPYLVTEHTGHMFPTKSFDHEQKRLEHTKRHLNIINHMLGDSEVSGVIGWCMHDYNTHIDFGSGDKICYHGVLDMFRNDKLAAAAYKTNQSHTPYLEVSSNFSIGDYPKGFVNEVFVFSNCDQVFVYRNNVCIGELKRDLKYKHLPYAPYQMDWFGDLLVEKEGLSLKQSDIIKKIYKDLILYGEDQLPAEIKDIIESKDDIKLAYQMYGKYVANWGSKSISYTFKGYNKGTLVIETTKGNDFKHNIRVLSDTLDLYIDDTYDVAKVTVEAINEYQHRLVYANDAFEVITDDLVEVIGPKTLSLIGGIRSFWIKTKHQVGTSYVTIKHPYYQETLMFRLHKEEIK
ncbi:MAG: glycoside hydrolase family 2 protein [Bacillota bacterium]|nr:MAG: glycoside hydrolase family 2 protein [Bacillota bacterium]